jgi:hypothetical protein|tara:strand:+ start:206 stop:400 length:195 start_codon:yes stop_codon:yes gene_type:complete
MYDCDEYGLNDSMERELRKQYYEEQQERKHELIYMLDKNECHYHERDRIIHDLRTNYNYEYKKQ